MIQVIFTSPYVPAEWIAAHGLSPSRILIGTKGHNPTDNTEGVCPYVSRFIQETGQMDNSTLFVFTTECDQMRRGSENISDKQRQQTFLMNIPTSWNTPESSQLYQAELKRLGRFLNRHGGDSPTHDKLTQVMKEYEKLRSNLKAQRHHVSAKIFSEKIAEFHKTGQFVPNFNEKKEDPKGIRIALMGGPLTSSDFILFDEITENGGRIILDGTETGERTLPRSFDSRQLVENPLEELTDAYIGSIPDAFRRPNDRLYQWIKSTFEERNVEGVLLIRRIWCDIWHGEVGRLREWLNIPLLDIDLDGNVPQTRIQTRIQAFMETLR